VKIATWNVNSLRVRLPQVIDWLQQHDVDILCLQELKLPDDKFPLEALQEIGYQAAWAGQPTYNGVALVSKLPGTEVQRNLPDFEDPQQRLIAATYETEAGPLRVASAYCPNGEALDSDKFVYKMAWFEAFHSWLAKEQKKYPQLVVLGDYNIAPADIDVHDPKRWEGKVHTSPEEREHFQALLQMGFVDAFRAHHPDDPGFSWWDYRRRAFARDAGLRIDHALVSQALWPHCVDAWVDKDPRSNTQPSDHTPVVIQLSI